MRNRSCKWGDRARPAHLHPILRRSRSPCSHTVDLELHNNYRHEAFSGPKVPNCVSSIPSHMTKTPSRNLASLAVSYNLSEASRDKFLASTSHDSNLVLHTCPPTKAIQ
ncbi:hypothetical protein M758_6G016000 [Ceratodon purpureus]|nr:hypothetical protein M758_6G016000 [Ceratodon purpureus]